MHWYSYLGVILGVYMATSWYWRRRHNVPIWQVKATQPAGEVLLHLSPENDRWNKMALGISDEDVPSRPRFSID